MSLPKYPHYKPSGVQWLGDVPAHWEVGPLKRAVALVESGVSVNAVDEPAGPGMVGVLKTSAVYSGRFEPGENKAVVAEDLDRVACPVKAGTLIVSRMNTPSLVGAAGLVADDAENLFLPDRLWQVHLAGALPQFVHFWTLSPSYRAQVQMACAGTSASMQNLSQDEFLRFVLPLPSLEEQTAIAHFLDHETAKIDALIAEQEKLIHLLAEKRQATISHAVTRGLDPAAPMKDSGVAWLGEVPAHWTVCPIKLVARIGNGSTPNRDNPDYWAEEGFPWLNSSVVNQDEVSEAERFVTELALAECHLPVIEPPAILVGITGQGKTRGMATRLAFKATVNQHLAYIKPTLGRIDEKFLLRIFEAVYLHLRTESEGAGSTKGAITCEQLGNLRIPVPNLAEQIEIAAKIETETTRLDALRAEAERAIALLKERRAALIAAAVTGQIDVRQNSGILNGGEARDAVAALS